MTGNDWTVGSVLEAAERWLAERGRGGARRRSDLCSCLAAVCGTDRLRVLMDHERPLGEAERASFRGMVRRLGEGEPLAYVLGRRSFHGRVFEVDPSVLIPRPETECLVEAALASLPEGSRVFEPGTGSGCIAVSLVLERPDLEVLASDLSPEALALARRNARTLGAPKDRLVFRRGDWWEAARGERFDALVSNPPYVDPRRPELCDPEVLAFEPAEALFASAGDPLAAVRTLLEGCGRGLNPGGLVFLELGIDTIEGARLLAEECGSLEEVRVLPDLGGRPRILRARRKGSSPDPGAPRTGDQDPSAL